MLDYAPFPIVAVHDEFKCHPNHMNRLRFHYREILAELSESTILSDIFGRILGQPITYHKLAASLGTEIRQSNYAIC